MMHLHEHIVAAPSVVTTFLASSGQNEAVVRLITTEVVTTKGRRRQSLANLSLIVVLALAFLQLAVAPEAQAQQTDSSLQVGVATSAGLAGQQANRLKAQLQTQTAEAQASDLTGKLVFQEHNGGMIYLYDLESKTLKTLTTGYDPALSPDGSTVAFIRYGGEQGLYLIDADGTDERRIYGGSRDLRAPSWSPDGQYIIFSRVHGEEYCRQVGPRCVPDRPDLEDFPLVIMDKRGLSSVNTDGGDFHDIPAMESATASDWNEAGIVYAAAEGIQVTAEQTDSASRSLLDARNSSAQDPDWQPGGGRIIFQRKEGTHWEIFSVNPDGSDLKALTRPVSVLVKTLPQNVSPAWSPDGCHIVYLSNRDATNSAGAWHLWVMDADGSNQRMLDPSVLGKIEFRYDTSVDQMVAWS